jgi:acetolactate synthase-1/2/3 large subunit
MRSFPSDLSLAAPVSITLAALDAALAKQKLNVEPRRATLVERHQARRQKAAREAKAGALNAATFSAAVGETVGEDAIIFNEYPLSLEHCAREQPGTFYGLSAAGGLGWGLGAALGAKLASPDKFVVATIGDGAYMFANPTVCHWVAGKFDIPVLTVVFNNSRYGAVRRATLSMFKDGAAGEDDGQFLADLSPSPPFEEFVRVQGGHGERVETHAELAPALARARDAVRAGRQALVNVLIPN